MNLQTLKAAIFNKKSFLCVGLDTDVTKLPHHLKANAEGMLEFNKAIIDATLPYAVSYKINTAFYEAMGAEGWNVMQKTVAYLPDDVFKIADAKRGDIGNTAAQYAKTFFEQMNFDAITLHPYMGLETFEPFLAYTDKWIIPLALTSNPGSEDFQKTDMHSGKMYELFLSKMASRFTPDKCMFVVGATQKEYLEKIRSISPNHFLLIPGVGTQGGKIEDLIPFTNKENAGMLVNVSRGIIFASSDKGFAEKAALSAKNYQSQMSPFFEKF
ncbi:MAG: orotidine-5'-phosphate decarboxylase [Chitinophagaceae bacterium]|nr:MAG: orotidine-5'-phosphate decarboxylase [Chitinophagaceae bacterium]